MNVSSQRVLVFDLNGTLLDLSALDGRFEHIFGTRGARELWFKELTTLVLTSVITGRYLDFPTQANAALTVLAESESNCRPAVEPPSSKVCRRCPLSQT
jgi:2-haloacid dehalogenase